MAIVIRKNAPLPLPCDERNQGALRLQALMGNNELIEDKLERMEAFPCVKA